MNNEMQGDRQKEMQNEVVTLRESIETTCAENSYCREMAA